MSLPQNRANARISAYRRRKKMIALAIVLVVLILGLVATLLVTKVYILEKINITGNVLYEKEQLEEQLMSDKYSFSTLYMYFKYKFSANNLNIPFIDSVEVSMEPGNPHELNVEVYEKKTLGYIYIPSIDQNAYFDRDGFVVETSQREIKGVPKITGLDPDSVVLYEKLDLKDAYTLDNLLQLTQLLEKYDISCKDINYNPITGAMTLNIKKIQVNVGSSAYLAQKILRLERILPEIKGRKGILKLSSWTPETTDIVFTPIK